MNQVDYDPEIFDVDEYGNLIKKNQDDVKVEDKPAECEDYECSLCTLNDDCKGDINCPRVNPE